MAAGGIGFMELLILILGGGGGIQLPVGLPPTAEDPKMAQVAPAECIAYITWAGTADADPNSPNRAERILAEPQVRHLFKTIETEIFAMIDRETQNNEEEGLAMSTAALLIKHALTHPAAIYLSKFEATDRGVSVEAGLVVNLGDEAPAMEKALKLFEKIIPDRYGPVRVIDGMRRIPVDEDAPPLGYTVKDGYLLIAVGKETQTALLKAFDNGPKGGPDWLKTARGKVSIKRTSSFIYINAAPLRDSIIPTFMLGIRSNRDLGEYGLAMKAMGLDKLTAIISSTGFDDEGFVGKTLLATKDNPGGIFKLFNKKGLTPADLVDVPKDADLAFVVRLNASEIFDEVFKGAGIIDQRAEQEMRGELANMERELGFKLKEDLFDSLGDVWSIYNSPGEGGLIITGLTGIVQVRDRDKMKKCIDRFAELIKQDMNRNFDPANAGNRPWRRRQYQFKSMDFMGHQIQYINPIGDDWVVTPAWCLTKDRFVIAPYPQMIKSYLERRSKADAGSLADLPQIKGVLKNSGGPSIISYMDTPELFKKVYPLAHPFATLICAQLQRETGMKIDASLLPTASSILPHLKPDVSTITIGDGGVLIESRQSIPLMGTLTSVPMFAMYFWAAEARYDSAVAIARAEQAHGHAEDAHDHGHGEVGPPRVIERPVPPANKRTLALNQLRNIGVSIFIYYADQNKAPDKLNDLTPKYLKKLDRDPWGQDYTYLGKGKTPAGPGSDKMPLAATSHLINNQRIVLYGDGHVEMVSDQEYKKQLEANKLPYAKPVELKEEHESRSDPGEGIEVPKEAPRKAPPRPAVPPGLRRPLPAPTEPDAARAEDDERGAAAIDLGDWPAWGGVDDLPEEPFIPGRLSVNTTAIR